MLLEKNVPLRMCVACRKKMPKTELLRIVRQKETGKIFIDENVKDYTLSYDLATDYSYISTTNTSVITLDRKAYDKSITKLS